MKVFFSDNVISSISLNNISHKPCFKLPNIMQNLGAQKFMNRISDSFKLQVS